MKSKKSAKQAIQPVEVSTIKLSDFPDETLEAVLRYLPQDSLKSMTLVSRRFYPIATSLLHEHIAFFDYKLAKALVKAHDLHSETPKCKILARYTSNLALHEDLHLSASDYRNTVERQTFADIFGACNGGQIRTLMIGFNPVNDLAKHICYVKAIEKAEMRPTKLTLLRSKFQIAMLLLVYLGATLEDLRLRDLTDLSSFSTSIPYGKVLRNLAVAPQLKKLILFGPLMSFRLDSWSAVALSACDFSNLRVFKCFGIPFNSYKAVTGSVARLEKLELAYLLYAQVSVLSTIPTSIHVLKYEGVSVECDPPNTLFDSLVKLKNLKKLPEMRYEPVPIVDADVGLQKALMPVKSKLLNHFNKMGVSSTKDERSAFLPYSTYGDENQENEEQERIAERPVKPTGATRRSWKERLQKNNTRNGKTA
ncbi:hypothetical protein P389DRAFT_207478 [Cystobasidium minutum MCA 4210]|uniref:uncharacterized protein n=1 Tax=Cystobasidium minutum MCA 4210 TaxID=1397322 RepID=UPI0034CF416A|eukprot:jgi/Rhomi1/207478/estExt_Genemark1.C_1_t10387